ncbi:MAG: hypothetical protein ABIZ81_03110, partial [Opitutaceae bacterium]
VMRKLKRARVGKVRGMDDAAFRKLGSTPEARGEAINRMFDQKREVLSFSGRYEFAGTNAEKVAGTGYVQFRISRSLLAMEAKEREFLRSTFFLRNAGLLNDDQWDFYQFAFMNGDGKASIDECEFRSPDSAGIKDAPAAVRFYQTAIGCSVDSAVNALLGVIRKAEQDPAGPAVVQELKTRLSGGSSWFEGGAAGAATAAAEAAKAAAAREAPARQAIADAQAAAIPRTARRQHYASGLRSLDGAPAGLPSTEHSSQLPPAPALHLKLRRPASRAGAANPHYRDTR